MPAKKLQEGFDQMLILPEAVLAVTTMCTSAGRRRSGEGPDFQLSNAVALSFQMQTGISLERKVTEEIQELNGVEDVQVVRTSAASYEVNVILGTYAYENYQEVIGQELFLFDKHPDLDFVFNINFSERASNSGSVARNVA